jgi:hypothetical protein
MPTPSLLIVPARFKSGKLYSQLPTSGAGDFTVTRATNATRVNASGLIESVASGIPRLDYFASDGTVGCPALLVEPSGTNTLSGSVSLDTGWTITADTIVTSGIISPSGSTNATLFQATNTASRVRQTATLASGSTYTFSCFGKFGALSSGFSLNVFDENAASYGSGVCQAFNLNEGTLGASGTTGAGFTLQSVGMENYGSGWYRCRMTVLMGYTPTTPRVGFRVGTQISGRPLSVASGTVNAWGAQLETGSVATSYIPTTTAAVTRNADVVSVSGAVSGSIGQTQGTIYMEVDVRNWVNSARIFSISDGTSNNRIMTLFNSSNRFRVIVDVSGSSAQADISSASLSNGIHKIAVGYVPYDVVFYVDGVLVGSDNTANIPACSQVFLGKIETAGSTLLMNDRFLDGALYTTRLSNAELAALTSL